MVIVDKREWRAIITTEEGDEIPKPSLSPWLWVGIGSVVFLFCFITTIRKTDSKKFIGK